MSEHLPYEERFKDGLNDLPLPDENAAWDKMADLLDKEDDQRRPPLVPPGLRSCVLWGTLLVALLASGWFFLYNPDDEQRTSQQSGTKERSNDPVTTTTDPGATSLPGSPSTGDNPGSTPVTGSGDAGSPGTNDLTSDGRHQQPGGKEPTTSGQATATERATTNSATNPAVGTEATRAGSGSLTTTGEGSSTRGRTQASNAGNQTSSRATARITAPPAQARRQQSRAATRIRKGAAAGSKPASVGAPDPAKTEAGQPQTTLSTVPVPTGTDTSATPAQVPSHADTVKATSPVPAADSTAPAAPDSSKGQKPSKKYWYVTAGLGIQQQIPVAGQSAVPYNYLGRTGSLYDYIPSVYVRLHRGEKWFLQGEFRFGAPQQVKEFSFARNSSYDTSRFELTTVTTRLKKTYYHQIPLSFNYYIRPGWSVGAGGIYNTFYGAVTEVEEKSTNVITQQESIKTKIQPVKSFTDSFLYRTQVNLLLQTDLEWRRFSFGLRYTLDLQPYIKYTRPDGTIAQEKNYTFQFILRYRLWKSGRF